MGVPAQTRRLSGIVAFLVLSMSIFAGVPAAGGDVRFLLTGSVDSTGRTASGWTSTLWTPKADGEVQLELNFAATADLRLEVRRESDGQWIGADLSKRNPKLLTIPVQAGVEYQVAVWAMSGSSWFAIADAANPTPPGDSERPNILVIMTDDQRRDSMDEAMPKTLAWMADQGTRFTEGYVTTPSCCPSRASVLTGQYNHNNGVVTQAGPAFDESTSIARYLSDAGYATAHIGKYVHYLDLKDRAPYWDRWTAYQGGYTDVYMNVDGSVVQSDGYSTTITFDRAIEYATDFKNIDDDQPWLMHVWPTAPHRRQNEPPTVEEKYRGSPVPAFERDPRTYETDISDKPPFMYCCPGQTNPTYIENVRDEMLRALYSVDDGVDRLLQYLEDTGELDNTLVFFLSDNGWMFGDHQLHEKFVPYENSVGVPFLMRWPGTIPAGEVSDRFVANIDILPTALAAAKVPIPDTVDGQDLLGEPARTHRLTEYFQDLGNIEQVTDWASIVTANHEYTEWYHPDGSLKFAEFYDRVNDPYQLHNLLGDADPTNDPSPTIRYMLSTQLGIDRSCAGSTCP